MRLWPHQSRGLDELQAAVSAGETAICVTSPTGGGKSRMLYEDIYRQRASAIVYTDRKMLLEQLSRGLADSGIPYGIRAAGYDRDPSQGIQLGMMQTEVSRCVRGQNQVHSACSVYVDEAHKNAADCALQLIDKHRQGGAVLVGFTATPLGIGHLYDRLIVAGTNSELRKCGALVPAHTYGPDEPDRRWIGRVQIGEGECGIQKSKRMVFAQQVFGRVLEHYKAYNPGRLPAILFAPGVPESIWFCEQLNERGIPAAHIDGTNCWLDGRLHPSNEAIRVEIAERTKCGNLRIVCNRFVLREGIDWPFLHHGIFATVFGSLTAYIQAGGRILRAHPGLTHVVIQDHGGNWWRHGSLNSDRQWHLQYTDRIAAGVRESRIREGVDPQPRVCAKCKKCRLYGHTCPFCGYVATYSNRPVLQRDGSLREMRGDVFVKRRVATDSERLRSEWCGRVLACRRSKKPTVRSTTFAQLEVRFARDNNWRYPPRDWPMMPTSEADWFRPVCDVEVT